MLTTTYYLLLGKLVILSKNKIVFCLFINEKKLQCVRDKHVKYTYQRIEY